jgi:hypothetical protein
MKPGIILIGVLIIIIAIGIFFVVIKEPEQGDSIERGIGAQDVDKASDLILSEGELDIYGNALAEWADEHHAVIMINGLDIQRVGPNAGGYSPIYWDNSIEDYRRNLDGLIARSFCDVDELQEYLSVDISGDTKEDLVSNIKCLGDIEFSELSEGLL